MRRSSLLPLMLLLPLLTDCGGDAPRKLRVELPTYSVFHPEEFQDIVLTDFLIVGSPEGFDLNAELTSFFAPEFARKLGLPVVPQRVPVEDEAAFQKPDFWQALAPASPRRLFVTGRASLTRELRKAILGEVPGEDPFTPERKVVERTLFSLSLRLLIIRGGTGEVLLDRDFKEVRTYSNPGQRTDFALYDLAMRIKGKLFRPLLSEERTQERYLLPR